MRALLKSALVLGILAVALAAQPNPGPTSGPAMVWIDGGGAIGENVIPAITASNTRNTGFGLAYSFGVWPQPPVGQLAPPAYLLGTGVLNGGVKWTTSIPIANLPALVGLPVYLQGAVFQVPTGWVMSSVCAWAIAPNPSRRFVVQAQNIFSAIPGFSGHTATVLPGSTILFAGGNVGSTTAKNAAVVYDPNNGQANFVGRLNVGRDGHTAARLGNGRVLIVGGDVGGGSPTAELYDPFAKTFASLGQVPYGLRRPMAAVIRNGAGAEFVLVAGGTQLATGASSASAMLYDVANRSFLTLPSLSRGRSGAAIRAYPSIGAALITGGVDQLGIHSSAVLFLLGTRSFYPWGNMQQRRFGHAMVPVDFGRTLIIGGMNTNWLRDTELYDAAALTSVPLPYRMTFPRMNFTPARLADGSILVAGGGTGRIPDAGRVPERLTGTGFTPLRPIPEWLPAIELLSLPGGGALAYGGQIIYQLR